MSLKEKLLYLLLVSSPKADITYKQAAKKFGVNTGAVGSAAQHLPKNLRRRIRRQKDQSAA